MCRADQIKAIVGCALLAILMLGAYQYVMMPHLQRLVAVEKAAIEVQALCDAGKMPFFLKGRAWTADGGEVCQGIRTLPPNPGQIFVDLNGTQVYAVCVPELFGGHCVTRFARGRLRGRYNDIDLMTM